MGPGPPTFFQGGPNLRVYFCNNTLHECIWYVIGLPSKLKPRKERKSRDVFFKILFVGSGEQKKCYLLIAKKINLRLVNVKLSILTYKRQTSDW